MKKLALIAVFLALPVVAGDLFTHTFVDSSGSTTISAAGSFEGANLVRSGKVPSVFGVIVKPGAGVTTCTYFVDMCDLSDSACDSGSEWFAISASRSCLASGTETELIVAGHPWRTARVRIATLAGGSVGATLSAEIPK